MKNTRMQIIRAICGTAYLAVAASAVQAQVQRTGGGANAQIVQQYQQVLAERGAMQAENDKLKKDLDDAKKKMADMVRQLTLAKSSATNAQTAIATAQASSRNSEQALEQNKLKLQEIIGRYRETAEKLASFESDNTQLKQKLTSGSARYDQCARDNVQLYQISNEVLDRYLHQSLFGVMARSEPFTRIKRTQLDNLVFDYQQRVDALRLPKTVASDVPAVDQQAPAQSH